MTAATLAQYIGRHGDLQIEDLRITVRVLDARNRFGTTDLLVSPILGDGQQWVEARRADIVDQDND